ncbi:hypothetical protein MVES1_001898 [Malassezia vespertilionis]|uniref:Uncharacterized protein n=1 Tax=Malassezia vespertilionis TaxID=2020962 RepID=A0A2N1JD25_9BASI|nr:uncharacterized protein MVES1_001898 [Malassezia vespertilionis]PKI84471.1 hypothetical protein MVES_001800 [Malassezia vespertilionis]WFD06547.1 hypothetical protein MVES1_001898 [Malassezia vespertilionis]
MMEKRLPQPPRSDNTVFTYTTPERTTTHRQFPASQSHVELGQRTQAVHQYYATTDPFSRNVLHTPSTPLKRTRNTTSSNSYLRPSFHLAPPARLRSEATEPMQAVLPSRTTVHGALSGYHLPETSTPQLVRTPDFRQPAPEAPQTLEPAISQPIRWKPSTSIDFPPRQEPVASLDRSSVAGYPRACVANISSMHNFAPATQVPDLASMHNFLGVAAPAQTPASLRSTVPAPAPAPIDLAAEAPISSAAATGAVQPCLIIEYCNRCRWQHRAAWLQTELLLTFQAKDAADGRTSRASGGGALASTMLIPCVAPETAGRFRVWLITEALPGSPNAGATVMYLLWDRKQRGGFPDLPELKRLVRDRIAPGQDLGHSEK